MKWTPLILLALVALPSGCNRTVDRTSERDLVIFAASSLTDAFGELESRFETRHPDVDVRLNFAGSQVLRLQIEQGAKADLFASADPGHLEALQTAGLLGDSTSFARGSLVVVVAEPNDEIRQFTDLPKAQRIVLGAPSVPVGRYARRALETATEEHASFAQSVLERVVSEELNTRLVRAKVELGEADAAIVYRSDAVGAEGVRVIAVPEKFVPRIDYRIGEVDSDPEAARWVEFLGSEEAATSLSRHGFGRP